MFDRSILLQIKLHKYNVPLLTRYGGSLPNVNQMATVGGGGGGSDVPQSGAALPGDV